MNVKFADVSIFLQLILEIPIITNAIKGEPDEIFSFCLKKIVGKDVLFDIYSGLFNSLPITPIFNKRK